LQTATALYAAPDGCWLLFGLANTIALQRAKPAVLALENFD